MPSDYTIDGFHGKKSAFIRLIRPIRGPISLFHLRHPQPVAAAFAVGVLDGFGGTENDGMAKYHTNYRNRNGLSNPYLPF